MKCLSSVRPMSLAYFVSFLCVAACQQSTTVSLEQWKLPLRNGSSVDTITSSLGTLRHIQTLRLQQTNMTGSQFGGLSSIIVTPDGSEVLTVSDRGLFVGMNLSSTRDAVEYDVKEALLFPMHDPQGQTIPFGSIEGDAEGLTVNGRYEGGGKGELYVSYEGDHRVLRFLEGVGSPRSTNLNVSNLLTNCPSNGGLEAILKQQPSAGRDGLLLMLCEEPPISSTTDLQGRMVLPGWAYNETSNEVKRFFVESNQSFFPTDFGELNNGDLMILFRRFVPNEGNGMRIGYITKAELQEALAKGETMKPFIIAEIFSRDGYNIDNMEGLAVRDDPRTGRIFVYVISDNNYNEVGQKTLLSTFEWTATAATPSLAVPSLVLYRVLSYLLLIPACLIWSTLH